MTLGVGLGFNGGGGGEHFCLRRDHFFGEEIIFFRQTSPTGVYKLCVDVIDLL